MVILVIKETFEKEKRLYVTLMKIESMLVKNVIFCLFIYSQIKRV